MKKFVEWCLSALLAAGLVLAVGTGINACSERGLGSYIIKGPSTYDVTDVESSVENYLNPTLSTFDEVLAYQIVKTSTFAQDSVFRCMSEDTINKVVSVLKKDNSTFTVSDIVGTYLANRTIYDNTPPSVIDSTSKSTTEKPVASIFLVQEGTTKVTEAPPTRVSETTTSVKDTTIDGKKATVTTTIQKHE